MNIYFKATSPFPPEMSFQSSKFVYLFSRHNCVVPSSELKKHSFHVQHDNLGGSIITNVDIGDLCNSFGALRENLPPSP
jgi:hypothetical protein